MSRIAAPRASTASVRRREKAMDDGAAGTAAVTSQRAAATNHHAWLVMRPAEKVHPAGMLHSQRAMTTAATAAHASPAASSARCSDG
jgi:hypothetical protein